MASSSSKTAPTSVAPSVSAATSTAFASAAPTTSTRSPSPVTAYAAGDEDNLDSFTSGWPIQVAVATVYATGNGDPFASPPSSPEPDLLSWKPPAGP